MDFKNEVLPLSRIREIDLAHLLAMLGHQPVSRKKNDTDYWYLSPLRNERTASFHINCVTNQWYDFGLAAGGNTVDFLLRYYDCRLPELRERLTASFSAGELPNFEPVKQVARADSDNKLVVKEVRPLYSYPLKNYLHERSIPIAVADQFCVEVSCQVKGGSYYGIGFKNDAGGYEIRNKSFKQSSAPKDITVFDFGAESVQVFEGFFDFLSWHTLHPSIERGTVNFVVLNGVGMFDRALPFLAQHEKVGLWLDQDVTGRAFTEYALTLGERFKDESGMYSQHKDLNDWLVNKVEIKQLKQKPYWRLFAGR